MFALWIVPDWLGSGDLLHTFHLARISAEPRSLQGTGDPALGARCAARPASQAGARVDRGAVRPGVWGWRSRDRTVAALALVAAAWALPTVAGTAMGYPAVPRYLVVPAAIALRARRDRAGRASPDCARVRAPALRWRRPWSPSAPRSPSPARSVSGTAGRGREGSGRRGLGAVAGRRPGPARGSGRAAAPGDPAEWHGQRPGLEARAVRLDHVAAWFSPGARIAFIAGDDRPVIARLHAATQRRSASRPRPRGMCCWCAGGRGRPLDESGP